MLRIIQQDIIPEESELLYQTNFANGELEKDFEIGRGDWKFVDGWLQGEWGRDGGALIYSKQEYLGDVLLDFEARTVPPCDNDLNFTFCAKGWNEAGNTADVSYIGGLQGWWLGKTGLEKYPKCDVSTMTSMHHFVAGKTYHIQTGRVGKRLFIFIDGELAVECVDPDPLPYGKIGFGVYASKAQFRNLKVYRPLVKDFRTTYQELHMAKGK